MRSFVCLGVVAVFMVAGCSKPVPVPVTEVIVAPAQAISTDPSDAAWDAAPEYVAKLIPQDLVEPRLMDISTPEVRVRAIGDGQWVAFRLQWPDVTKEDFADPGKFVDACAVQTPAEVQPTVPAPQMGETGRAVQIAYWNAGWQATLDGRGDTIRDLYPNAAVDHYPFHAPSLAQGSAEQRQMETRYAPAKAAGNFHAGPRESTVQDLIAEGPGTIAPAPESYSRGQGVHDGSGWTVVIVRRLPDLTPQTGTQVAFAVWQGAQEEVGSRKMRTGWVPLVVKGTP